MAYVDRANGKIVSTFANQQYEGQEELADDAPEVVAFLEALTNPPPTEVSSGQLILALHELGLLAAVDAAVAQADPMSQRLWARASRFPRNDPMVVAIATAIGQTSGQLDAIFQLASTK